MILTWVYTFYIYSFALLVCNLLNHLLVCTVHIICWRSLLLFDILLKFMPIFTSLYVSFYLFLFSLIVLVLAVCLFPCLSLKPESISFYVHTHLENKADSHHSMWRFCPPSLTMKAHQEGSSPQPLWTGGMSAASKTCSNVHTGTWLLFPDTHEKTWTRPLTPRDGSKAWRRQKVRKRERKRERRKERKKEEEGTL